MFAKCYALQSKESVLMHQSVQRLNVLLLH